jgi:hypothetical protein
MLRLSNETLSMVRQLLGDMYGFLDFCRSRPSPAQAVRQPYKIEIEADIQKGTYERSHFNELISQLSTYLPTLSSIWQVSKLTPGLRA